MTEKEKFISEIEPLIVGLSAESQSYFEKLKNDKPAKEKVEITENGAKILAYMQENWSQYNNVFKSKEIAEGLFVSSRSVSGSMKKLITEGFVEKIGTDPVAYAITDKGKEKNLSNI
jgi:DNA-binding MarR family transcriptional regulator